MKSEFITLDNAGEEAELIQNFLEDIPCWEKLVSAICVYCDSQSTTWRVQISMYNRKSIHICHIYNIVKHLLSNVIIFIDYVKSNENIVDPLIKGLSRELVYNSSKGMSLKPLKDERV
jgi:hypothetical protein